PFRTDFFLEFQMQLAFPIPLALLGLLRFLESGRWRPLLATALLVWVEALASMYYAIILGLALVGWAGPHPLPRSGRGGGGTVGGPPAPGPRPAWPRAPSPPPPPKTRRERGGGGELTHPALHSADLYTSLETGVTRLYQFRPSGHIAETSLFMGFVPLLLAVAAAGLAPAPAPGPARPPPARPAGRLDARIAVGARAPALVLLRTAPLAARRPPLPP